MVVTFGMMKYPTIFFQPLDDISTVHKWKVVGNPCQFKDLFSQKPGSS